MATSLASQLQKLQDRPDHDHKLNESFLFSKTDARSYSREQIQQLAMEGLRTLVSLDNRMDQFVDILFDITAARRERSMLTQVESKELDEHIEHFMTLLAPHFLTTAAHQCFEYLVRVHEVHTFNVKTILRALLPYHDHGLFVRVILLLDLRSTGFDFMKANQDKGAPLPRTTLNIAAAENPKVLQMIVEGAQFSIQRGVVNNGAIGLWVGVATALATTPEGESVFRMLLPSLVDWIPCSSVKKANQGPNDLPPAAIGSIAAGALIVLCTWSSEVALGVKTLTALVHALLQAMQVAASSGVLSSANIVAVLAHLFATQKAVVSQAPFVTPMTTLLEELPWAALGKEVEAARGHAMVSSLVGCACTQLQQHEASRRFIAVAAEHLTLTPTNVHDIMVSIVKYQHFVALKAEKSAADASITKAVHSLQRRFTVAFDQTIGSLLSNQEVCDNQAVDSFLRQVLTGTRYMLVEVGGNNAEGGATKLPLSTCLLSHIPEVRLRGVKSLLPSAENKKKGTKAADAAQSVELSLPIVELLSHTLRQETHGLVTAAILELLGKNLPSIFASLGLEASQHLLEASLHSALWCSQEGEQSEQVIKTLEQHVLAPLIANTAAGTATLSSAAAWVAVRLGLTLNRPSFSGKTAASSLEAIKMLKAHKPETASFLESQGGKLLKEALSHCLTTIGPKEDIVAQLRKVDLELALNIAPTKDVAAHVSTTFSKLRDAETVKRGTAKRQEATPIRSPWLRILAECVTARVVNTPAAEVIATTEPLLETLCTLETRLPSLLHCSADLVQPLLSLYWNLLLASVDAETQLPNNHERFTLVAQSLSETNTTSGKIHPDNKKKIVEDPLVFTLPLLCPTSGGAGEMAVDLLRHLQSLALAASGPQMTKRNAIVEAVSCLLDEKGGVEVSAQKKGDLSQDTQAYILTSIAEQLENASEASSAAYNKAALALRLLFIPKKIFTQVIKILEVPIIATISHFDSTDASSATKSFLEAAASCVSFPAAPLKKHLASTAVLDNLKRMETMSTAFLSSGLPVRIYKPVLVEVCKRTGSTPTSPELLVTIADLWRQGGGTDVVHALISQHQLWLEARRSSNGNATGGTVSMFMDLLNWMLALFDTEVQAPATKKQRKEGKGKTEGGGASSGRENLWNESEYFTPSKRFKLAELIDEILAEAGKLGNTMEGCGDLIVASVVALSSDPAVGGDATTGAAPTSSKQILSAALGWSCCCSLVEASLNVELTSGAFHTLDGADGDEAAANAEAQNGIAATVHKLNLGALVPAVQSNERAVIYHAIRCVDLCIVAVKKLNQRPKMVGVSSILKAHIVKTILKVLASVIANDLSPKIEKGSGEEEDDIPAVAAKFSAGAAASGVKHLTTEGTAAAVTASPSIKQLLHTVVPLITFETSRKRAGRKASEADSLTAQNQSPNASPSLFHVPILSMLLKLAPFLGESTGSSSSANAVVLDLLLSFEPAQQAECLTECLKAVHNPECIGDGLDEDLQDLARKILKPSHVASNRLSILTFVADCVSASSFLKPFIQMQELKYSNHDLGMNLVIAAVEVFTAAHASSSPGMSDENGQDPGEDDDQPRMVDSSAAAKFVSGNVLGCLLRAITNVTFAHAVVRLLSTSNLETADRKVWKVTLEAAIDRLTVQNAKASEVSQYSSKTAHLHTLMQILRSVNSITKIDLDMVQALTRKVKGADEEALDRVQLAMIVTCEIVRSATRSDLIVKPQLLAQMEEFTTSFDLCHRCSMQLVVRPTGQASANKLFAEYATPNADSVGVSLLTERQAILMATSCGTIACIAQGLGLNWMNSHAGDALTTFSFAMKAGIRDVRHSSLRYAALLAIRTALPSIWIMLEPFLPTLLASISSKLCAEDPATSVLAQEVLTSMGSLLEPRVLLPQITAAVNRADKGHSFAVLFRFVDQQLEQLSKTELKVFEEIMEVTLFTKAFESLCVTASHGDALGQPDPEDLKAIFSAFKTFFLKFKETDGIQFFSKIVEWACRISPRDGSAKIGHLDTLRWLVLFTMLEHYLRSMGTLLGFVFPVILGPMVDILEVYGPGQISNTLSDKPRLQNSVAQVVKVIFASIGRMCDAASQDIDEAIGSGVTTDAYLALDGVFEKVMPAMIQQVGNLQLFGGAAAIVLSGSSSAARKKAEAAGAGSVKDCYNAVAEDLLAPTVRSFFKCLNGAKLWAKTQYHLLKLLRDRSPIVRTATAQLFESIYLDGGDQMAATIMAEGLPAFVESTEDGDDDVVEAARKLCTTLSTITGQDVLHAMA